MPASAETLEIITCSYRPDRVRCERLCESVDRFVAEDILHTIIVPERDLAVFRGLENRRRRVVSAQDVLPGRYRQLPFTEKMWVSARGRPIRGWIMQQVVKLSASRVASAELMLFADSDLQFVRPFEIDRIYRDGRLRLHRVPGAMNEGRHLRWHQRAGTLLGKQCGYFGSDYVGQLISWRRSNLEALHRHIESATGLTWHEAVTRSLHVSEYILYGSFVEHVLGDEHNGHFYEAEDLCHCCWFDHQARDLLEGRQSLDPRAMALLVQSNLALSPAIEKAVLQSALGPAFACGKESWA